MNEHEIHVIYWILCRRMMWAFGCACEALTGTMNFDIPVWKRLQSNRNYAYWFLSSLFGGCCSAIAPTVYPPTSLYIYPISIFSLIHISSKWIMISEQMERKQNEIVERTRKWCLHTYHPLHRQSHRIQNEFIQIGRSNGNTILLNHRPMENSHWHTANAYTHDERETDLITISIRESEILNHWIFEHSALFSVYLFFFFMYNIYCYFCVCARVRYARLNFNFIIYNPKFSEWNDDTRHRNQTNKWATTKPTT